MANIKFSFLRGSGSNLEILYGKVSIKPTLAHARGTSFVLPQESSYDLVNGVATATDVQPTPAPVGGTIEWGYQITVQDRFGKKFEWLVGVPDVVGDVLFTALPRYSVTVPPLFGQGEQGIPGEAATLAVGTVTSGTPAAVSNSGTNQNAVLDFVLPKGDKGDTGAGVPSGGTALQYIRKNATNATTEWATLDKATVGLPNVDNTSDANKPVSTLQTEAILTSTSIANYSRAAIDPPSSYPQGITATLGRVNQGWPITAGGEQYNSIVTSKIRGTNQSCVQRAYPFNSVTETPKYRYSARTGDSWGEWQTLATGTDVAAASGMVIASSYPTVEESVAAALTGKRPLLVDSDLTSASLPSTFFQVDVLGKGSITVGGNKFWANPQHQGIQTNTLYINPTTGNDLNSGIDPAAPVKTFTRLNIHLTMLRERLMDGFWVVVIQSGTHMIPSGWRVDGLKTKWPIVVKGEGTLATILDGTNDTLGKAIYWKPNQANVTFENIKFQNYRGGESSETIDTNAAILVQGPGFLTVKNCEFINCTTGISTGYAGYASITNNYFRGDTKQSTSSSMNVGVVALYGASATITYNTFYQCVRGVHTTRNSVTHVDYNNFYDNYYGATGSHNARFAVLDGVFHRNMVALEFTGGAECTFAKADFGTGVNVNVLSNMQFSGTGKLTQTQGASPSATEYRLRGVVNDVAVSAPTDTVRNPVVVFPSANTRLPAGMMYGPDKKLRLEVKGELTNTSTGTRTLQLSKNSPTSTDHQVLSSLVIPSTATGRFDAELTMYTIPGSTAIRYASRVLTANGIVMANSGRLTGIDTSHEWLFRLYLQNSVAGAGMDIHSTELFITG